MESTEYIGAEGEWTSGQRILALQPRAYFLLDLLLSRTVLGEGMLLLLGPPALPKSHSVCEGTR